MIKTALSFLVLAQAVTGVAHAAEIKAPGLLEVTVGGIEHQKPIPEKYAYCVPDGKGKTKDGGNINPAISWKGAPQGTKSFALIVVDPDVPTKFDSANKDGQTISKDMPRRKFFHWVLIDIPANVTSIKESQDSSKVVKEGKPLGKTLYGINSNNDYSDKHGGYDGPCPPWNDEILHHYHFIVYALDVDTLGVKSPVNGNAVMDKIMPHVLAQGEVVGTFTNNPAVK